MADFIDLYNPKTTKVDPTSLKAARTVMMMESGLRELLNTAETEAWDADKLTLALQDCLTPHLIDLEAVPATARFLAEEFITTNKDPSKLILVSRATGFPIAQVPAEAIYQPEPVARENSDQLTLPLPRLIPELEAAITHRAHTHEVEGAELERAAKQLPSNELTREQGDPRLAIVTIAGRKALAQRVKESLPGLLDRSSSTVGIFLGALSRGYVLPDSEQTEFGLKREFRLEALGSVSMADPRAMNYRLDFYSAVTDQIRNQWARGLARQIAETVREQSGVTETSVQADLPDGVMIATPDVGLAFGHRIVLAVPNVPTVILNRSLYLTIKSFDSREVSGGGKWGVQATVSLEISVPKTLKAYSFSDLNETWIEAEIV